MPPFQPPRVPHHYDHAVLWDEDEPVSAEEKQFLLELADTRMPQLPDDCADMCHYLGLRLDTMQFAPHYFGGYGEYREAAVMQISGRIAQKDDLDAYYSRETLEKAVAETIQSVVNLLRRSGAAVVVMDKHCSAQQEYDLRRVIATARGRVIDQSYTDTCWLLLTFSLKAYWP